MNLEATLLEAAHELEQSLRHHSSGGEYNDSNGQTLAVADIHRFLLSQGLQPYPTVDRPSRTPPTHTQILTNKQQVNVHGTVLGSKLPDRAFVDTTGERPVRVNVEVDVDPKSFQQSRQKLLGGARDKPTDRQARHVFVQVDPDSGRVTRWEVYEPGRKRPGRQGTGNLPAHALLRKPDGDRQLTVIPSAPRPPARAPARRSPQGQRKRGPARPAQREALPFY